MVENNIGLKYFFKKYKGVYPHMKLKYLCDELSRAWQRAWIGYEKFDVICFDSTFCERTLILLDRLRNFRNIKFHVPKEIESYELFGEPDTIHGISFTKEESEVILDMMIYHLKMSDYDYVIDVIQDRYKKHNFDMYRDSIKIAHKNRKEFFYLFDLFFDQLYAY